MRLTIGSVLAQKTDGADLHAIYAGESVRDAVDLLHARGIGAVLIKNEEELIEGIFSERDLLRRVVFARVDPDDTPISMVMTRDVRFVSPQDSIEGALALMYVNRFRHLLVMDGPRVCGLISIRDMTEHLLKYGEGRFEAAVREAAEDTQETSKGDT